MLRTSEQWRWASRLDLSRGKTETCEITTLVRVTSTGMFVFGIIPSILRDATGYDKNR